VQRLPLDEWRLRVNDVYPAYVRGGAFVRMHALVQANYAEYDRNKTRGVPRPGAALLHGLVYCGACGHKLLVQDKGGTHSLCHYRRPQ